MINKFKNKVRGFTLIETLVAILILVTAITGPLTLAYKGFAAATVARDQITAFYLAQDALEYIRFARDTNRLSGGDWMTGVGGTASVVDLSNCRSSNNCYFDAAGLFPTTVQLCSGACPFMKFDPTAGTYQYTNGNTTTYRRTVNIITVNANEVIASTTVTWQSVNGVNRSATLFEGLTNWP